MPVCVCASASSFLFLSPIHTHTLTHTHTYAHRYQNLLRLADATQAAQAELQQRQHSLGCVSKLLVQLTGMRLQMPASDRSLLETYLCPDLPHSMGSGGDGLEGTGWEEAVELSLTYVCLSLCVPAPSLHSPTLTLTLNTSTAPTYRYLLKTALAKNPKSSTKVNTAAVEMPDSIDTLKQRISLVFVKLEEGKTMTLPDDKGDRPSASDSSERASKGKK